MERSARRRRTRCAFGLLALALVATSLGGPGARVTRAASFAVTTTAAVGPGSFAQAIADANGAVGPDTIRFAINAGTDPGCSGGVCTIDVAAGEQTITDAVEIDGYTRPGATANSLVAGTNAQLKIVVPFRLSINSGTGSTIKGLNIQATPALAINSNGNFMKGNFIGTTVDGSADFDATLTSVQNVSILQADNNTVGGGTLAARNLISGNGNGVRVLGVSPSGSGDFRSGSRP